MSVPEAIGGQDGKLHLVIEDIEGGNTLSEAMAKQPKAFDNLYVNMVKAGEAGGALESILQRLADFKEKAQSLKRKVVGAMIYPAAVITVAVAIVSFIMIWIIPKFKEIFLGFDVEQLGPPVHFPTVAGTQSTVLIEGISAGSGVV